MTAQTGRTVNRYITVKIHDSGGTLRTIPINSINGVGLEYETIDVTAWSDAVKGALQGMPSAEIEISGPFETTVHGYLSGIVGGFTPLTLDVQVGIRHAWEAGEPQFGITSTTANGYLCTAYTVNLADMTFTAKFSPYSGSAAPAWGTAAET